MLKEGNADSCQGEEKNPIDPNQQSISELREMQERSRQLKEIIEADVANGLCIPLYELTRLPPDEPNPYDTLSRLERIANPREPEYQRILVGACYRLDLKGDKFLVVLNDGRVIKIIAPDKNSQPGSRRHFEQYFSNLSHIEFEDLERLFANPTAYLGEHTDIPYDTGSLRNPIETEKIEEMVRADWKEAQEIKMELAKIRLTKIMAGLRALTSSPPPRKPPEEPKETPPSS